MADNASSANEKPKLDNSIQEDIAKELSLNHVEVQKVLKPKLNQKHVRVHHQYCLHAFLLDILLSNLLTNIT